LLPNGVTGGDGNFKVGLGWKCTTRPRLQEPNTSVREDKNERALPRCIWPYQQTFGGGG